MDVYNTRLPSVCIISWNIPEGLLIYSPGYNINPLSEPVVPLKPLYTQLLPLAAFALYLPVLDTQLGFACCPFPLVLEAHISPWLSLGL